MTLTELIAALEKATGPSKELNAHIWNAVYGHKDSWVAQSKNNFEWLVFEKCHRNGERLVEVRGRRQLIDFTSSIDAALTLVPEGKKWGVGSWSGNFANIGAEDNGKTETSCEPAASPAIALCIAALRSRT